MIAVTGAVLVVALRHEGCSPDRGTFSDGERESSWLSYSCGVDTDHPSGVLIHLHGDGAEEVDSPGDDLAALAEAANSRNMVLLVPRTPDLVTGGALMMGGGGVNEETGGTVDLWDGLPVQAASVLLRWKVGEQDDGTTSTDGFDALGAAYQGSEFWWDVGFRNVDLEVLDGRGHYDLPQGKLLAELLGD